MMIVFFRTSSCPFTFLFLTSFNFSNTERVKEAESNSAPLTGVDLMRVWPLTNRTVDDDRLVTLKFEVMLEFGCHGYRPVQDDTPTCLIRFVMKHKLITASHETGCTRTSNQFRNRSNQINLAINSSNESKSNEFYCYNI